MEMPFWDLMLYGRDYDDEYWLNYGDYEDFEYGWGHDDDYFSEDSDDCYDDDDDYYDAGDDSYESEDDHYDYLQQMRMTSDSSGEEGPDPRPPNPGLHVHYCSSTVRLPMGDCCLCIRKAAGLGFSLVCGFLS